MHYAIIGFTEDVPEILDFILKLKQKKADVNKAAQVAIFSLYLKVC